MTKDHSKGEKTPPWGPLIVVTDTETSIEEEVIVRVSNMALIHLFGEPSIPLQLITLAIESYPVLKRTKSYLFEAKDPLYLIDEMMKGAFSEFTFSVRKLESVQSCHI